MKITTNYGTVVITISTHIIKHQKTFDLPATQRYCVENDLISPIMEPIYRLHERAFYIIFFTQ